MSTVRDLLQDADPLRHESPPPHAERNRIRSAMLRSAPNVGKKAVRMHPRLAEAGVVALIVAGVFVLGFRFWTPGADQLLAAVRFEARLAEERPAPGLREARVALSAQVVYLHEGVVVTNADIAESRVVPGNRPSRFGVGVHFTEAGARKMRQATAAHIGRPLAILIDGAVVTAPVLRSQISESAVIDGDYSAEEAERIVRGISIR